MYGRIASSYTQLQITSHNRGGSIKTLYMYNFSCSLTFVLFLVPDTDHSLGMFPVVYEPLGDTLDALNGRVQVLQLFLHRSNGESTACTAATTAHLFQAPSSSY